MLIIYRFYNLYLRFSYCQNVFSEKDPLSTHLATSWSCLVVASNRLVLLANICLAV